ncbi:hypothetical protein SP36_70 [Salmonella phage 36]|nr:hypothetical protein SP36_70 [Salmonella phage 36]AKJ74042.1 hypothetical protein SP36_70 [Salmonella phage 36]
MQPTRASDKATTDNIFFMVNSPFRSDGCIMAHSVAPVLTKSAI